MGVNARGGKLGCTSFFFQVKCVKFMTINPKYTSKIIEELTLICSYSGIMTARLLPSYLCCFDDVYISVRIAAVTTASKLLLHEDKVITKLLFLTQYDNNWRVKAHALKGQ